METQNVVLLLLLFLNMHLSFTVDNPEAEKSLKSKGKAFVAKYINNKSSCQNGGER